MAIRHISVERLTLTSAAAFESVVAALEAAVGRPDMGDFRRAMAAAKSYAEMERVVGGAIGPSGFMEFARYDLGAILQRERGTATPRSLRLVIGNPLIMKEMLKHVADAGSYAPVTVLVDERAGGVHLSYDRMASLLAPYANAAALTVARDLDAKVEALLTHAAG